MARYRSVHPFLPTSLAGRRGRGYLRFYQPKARERRCALIGISLEPWNSFALRVWQAVRNPSVSSSITIASTFANLSNICRPSVAEWEVITLCFADSMSSLRLESPCAGSFSTIRNDSRWPLFVIAANYSDYLKMRKVWRQRARTLTQ
jgi:hypothetical protein